MKASLAASAVFLWALLAATAAKAVVLEPGVPDSQYLVAATDFPALVDLPGEGQGVLIARQWVVTAAHATQGYALKQVWVGDRWRDVAGLVLYPGFVLPAAAKGPLKGDAAPLMQALAGMHDIALIKLVQTVEDVEPVALYRGSDEQGQRVKLYGKGATGDGAVGEYPGSPHRGKLRRAYNRITLAHEQWLDYVFDCGPDALPQEGVLGDGDSGGPLLIEVSGHWELAGLADWKHWSGDLAKFRPGICGQVFSNSRISFYAGWIDSVMTAEK